MFDDRGENRPANDTIYTIHSFCLWLNIWCGVSRNVFCTVDGADVASDGEGNVCQVSVPWRLCSPASSLFASSEEGVR